MQTSQSLQYIAGVFIAKLWLKDRKTGFSKSITHDMRLYNIKLTPDQFIHEFKNGYYACDSRLGPLLYKGRKFFRAGKGRFVVKKIRIEVEFYKGNGKNNAS